MTSKHVSFDLSKNTLRYFDVESDLTSEILDGLKQVSLIHDQSTKALIDFLNSYEQAKIDLKPEEETALVASLEIKKNRMQESKEKFVLLLSKKEHTSLHDETVTALTHVNHIAALIEKIKSRILFVSAVKARLSQGDIPPLDLAKLLEVSPLDPSTIGLQAFYTC